MVPTFYMLLKSFLDSKNATNFGPVDLHFPGKRVPTFIGYEF